MGIGNSGRVVVEVDPNLKRELHATLMRDGLTLKDWFVKSAEVYLLHQTQMSLSLNNQEEKETENESI